MRLKLFSSNSENPSFRRRGFRRYLLYAIGEILLVVLGILIALQVNNWNNKRLERNAAVTFYENTRQQLIDDRNNLQGQLAFNNRHEDQFIYAIELIARNDRAQRDSLCLIAGHLADYSDFDRQGNIYETMVSSGDVRLLQNEEIKGRLRRLEETYIYVNRMESIHYDAVMQIIPRLIHTINFTSRKVIDEDRIYAPEFQNTFALALRIMDEKEQVYYRAIDEIDAIIALIEEDLKN